MAAADSNIRFATCLYSDDIRQFISELISLSKDCVIDIENLSSDRSIINPSYIIKEIQNPNKESVSELKSLRKKFPDSKIILIQDVTKTKIPDTKLTQKLFAEGINNYVFFPHQKDILQQLLTEENSKELLEGNSVLSSLLYISNELIQEFTLTNLLKKTINRTLALTGADTGAISILEKNTLVAAEIWDGEKWYTYNKKVSSDKKSTKPTEKNGSFIESSSTTDIFHITQSLLEKEKLSSYLNTPIMTRNGNIKGFLEIGTYKKKLDPELSKELLEKISKIVEPILEKIQLIESTKSQLETIKLYGKSFRNMVENAPFGIIMTHYNKIKFVNKKIVEALGYSRDELVGTNILNIVSSKHTEKYISSAQKALNSEKTSKSYVDLTTKEGTTYKTEIEMQSMLHEGEKFIQLAIIEASVENYRSIDTVKLAAAIDSINSAITITDMDKRITYINPSHTKTFGYEPKELIGQKLDILFPFDDPSGISKKIYDAIHLIGWEGERLAAKKNGEVFSVHEKIAIIKDKEGSSIGIVSILEDISERKRLENALRSSEKRYRTLVETASTAIISINEVGKIILFNPAAETLFGYRKEEIIGKNIRILLDKQFQQLLPAEKNNLDNISLFLEHFKKPTEITGIRKDEEKIIIEISFSKSIIDGSQVYTAIILDITERKKLQEQLIQSAKLAALGELVSGITHEVNNPLAVITGYSEMMMEEPSLTPDTRKIFQIIYKESERAKRVIKNLLSFARQHSPDKQKVSINEILDQTLELLEYDLRKNNIQVQRNYDKNLPYILADPNQLQQVFLNLIINAQHAISNTERQGEIHIETKVTKGTDKKPHSVNIFIRDNGCGIPKNILDKIFDPFFTTKPEDKGTGLGLSVSHGIIKEHGGNIYVESTEGKGTIFKIELPA